MYIHFTNKSNLTNTKIITLPLPTSLTTKLRLNFLPTLTSRKIVLSVNYLFIILDNVEQRRNR